MWKSQENRLDSIIFSLKLFLLSDYSKKNKNNRLIIEFFLYIYTCNPFWRSRHARTIVRYELIAEEPVESGKVKAF